MLPAAALEYHLDESLIATRPAEPRESARLMVLCRSDPTYLAHLRVADLPALLGAGHVLVFNRTRVLPARFVGRNLETGGHVEGLWLHDRADRPGQAWDAYLKARRFRPGRQVELETHTGHASGVVLTLVEKTSTDGAWLVDVTDARDRSTPEILDAVGLTPLPPYIRGARKRAGLVIPDEADRKAYQTVFAGESSQGPVQGSVAAPTAGLHFTPALLERLDRSGVQRAEVTLHVGAGTFKPIEAEHVEEHPMHAEWCRLGEGAWVMESARRVIAVGSTSARTLESFARHPPPRPEWLSTDLLIAPGYVWKRVDGLLTNFHLPRSTLLAMVAGFLPGGIDQLLALYRIAMERGYRFYSYGDAMLILP
ncbi:MAG: tRNA preQ1(34) S-adenosylmethionine ribosyltransferase-isomerase QueA [Phycisphaerales bacterium]|nr:tRNA preQ1(34) S-adenosylmethionine ribosyltransferase-isomerase QueA [Phycisphaerales bacterium]